MAVRFLTGGTIKLMLEVSEYLLFAMTFLGAPWVLREGAHTAVDLLVEALPKGGQRLLAIIAYFIGLATSIALAWYGWLATSESWRAKTLVFKQVTFPEWWLFSLIAFCGLLLIVQFLRLLVRAMRGDVEIAHRQATA